ncbi:site-2 protease family protein [Amycolatopsis taiwanensis]|uniref:Zinc metalloprotease n=1 Tax=Amycolatopsis taiwanensis TaxID=342230 RepID=A0A9W6R1X0_9PSEU|nr:site-2 protease family protein [Amycolatopsis taiwanensis]GLY67788.1 putative zinc metalloprotease Rip3 [Amycolatopsis taiwanensis]
MFSTSIPLGRVAGIRLQANWSVLIVLALIADLIAVSVLPRAAPGQSTFWYWVTALVTAACFLASLLAHELAHAVTARHYGMKVKRITLWMLGGVAELEGEPPSPRADFVIAIMGPLTSLVLGGACWGTAYLTRLVLPALVVLGLSWIGITNVLLAVFNLLPGAPLDGGRVLRAAVWKATGNRMRANAAAARTGQVLGLVLIAGGLGETLFLGSYSGLWLAFIGWFLTFAAQRELAGGVARERLAGVRLRNVMDPNPAIAPGWWTVEAFLDRVATTSRGRVFPVTSFDGTPLGVVSLAELIRLSEQDRLIRRVGDVARKPPRVLIADAAEQLVDVMGRTALRPGRDLILVTEHGRLAGVIGPDDFARTLELAASGHPVTGPPSGHDNPSLFDGGLRG